MLTLFIYSLALIALLYSSTYIWSTYWMYLKVNKKTDNVFLGMLWLNAFLILVVFSQIIFEFLPVPDIKMISDGFLLMAAFTTTLLAKEIKKGPYKTLKMITRQR